MSRMMFSFVVVILGLLVKDCRTTSVSGIRAVEKLNSMLDFIDHYVEDLNDAGDGAVAAGILKSDNYCETRLTEPECKAFAKSDEKVEFGATNDDGSEAPANCYIETGKVYFNSGQQSKTMCGSSNIYNGNVQTCVCKAAPADKCAKVECGANEECEKSSGLCGCQSGFVKDATNACIKEVDVGASVVCSTTGYKPTFSKAFEEGKTLQWDVVIGPSADTCKHTEGPITEKSTMSASDFAGGNDEIAYKTCGGTLANDDEKNPTKINFDVEAKITVREVTTVIARETFFKVAIKCSLTKEQDINTANENWVIDRTTGVTITDLTPLSKDIVFPIDVHFYTDASRTQAQTTDFKVPMGDLLYIRIKETTDNSFFRFVTHKCWFNNDPGNTLNEKTDDVFFDDGCMIDKDNLNNDFVDKAKTSPNFDMQVKSFFLAAHPGKNIYLHCELYVCMTDDTDDKCKQKTRQECGMHSYSQRRRRDVAPVSDIPAKQRLIVSSAFQVVKV